MRTITRFTIPLLLCISIAACGQRKSYDFRLVQFDDGLYGIACPASGEEPQGLFNFESGICFRTEVQFLERYQSQFRRTYEEAAVTLRRMKTIPFKDVT